jgi:hypothetical protein
MGIDEVTMEEFFIGSSLIEIYEGGVISTGEPGSNDLLVPFSYGDASPITLIPGFVGLLLIVEVFLLVPFSDSAASFSVGVAGDLDLLFRPNQAIFTEAGSYNSRPQIRFTVPTDIQMAIATGSSTAGSGIIKFTQG